jgi:phosphopantetheinyl transferase
MHIFLCDVGNIPRDVLKKAAERLPASRTPKEGIRADAFAARVAGTLLATYAIRQISPQTVCDIWGTTAEGKPFIQNCPVAFSITHANGIVGVAVSGNHPVGLDIEKIRPMRENFAARYFNNAEQAEILSASDPDEALIRLWTAKEAVGKYNGTGLGADIAAIDTRNAVSTVFERNGVRFALSTAPKRPLPPLEWVKFEDLVP